MSSFKEAILQIILEKATYCCAFSLGCSLLILSSCSATKTIPIETIKNVTKIDTIYLNTFRFDSTYVYHNLLTDRSKDTLLIKETYTEVRYKILRDTIERTRIGVVHDSIPYEVRITEIKEVKYTPPWVKVLAYIGSICILVLFIYTLTKLKRF